MDSETLKETVERVAKRQENLFAKSSHVIDTFVTELQGVKARVEASQDNQTHITALADLQKCLEEITNSKELSASQKELNNILTKLGKNLDKNFFSDLGKASWNVEFDQHILNEAITDHLYREGSFEAGDSFAVEAGILAAEDLKAPYLEICEIVEAVRRKDLVPVLDWAKAQRLAGEQSDSCRSLEFKLHRFRFVEILHNHGRTFALAYARENFGCFWNSHMVEIQKLMGCLLWENRAQESPYKDILLCQIPWQSLEDEFVKECCHSQGKPFECPLYTTVTAGAKALPILLKLANLLAKRPENWEEMKQLPVEIELGKEFEFHSVFACPVSREQSTADNPPMLMPCGHVLCKQSIVKLGRGSSRPFKCPYCPLETNQGQCRPIHF